MIDYISIGSAPSDENCVQVNPKLDYLPAMQEECGRFIELLRKIHGPEPEGARLRIKSNPHDFGTYLDVVCYFNDDLPEAVAYAFRLEAHVPRTWKS